MFRVGFGCDFHRLGGGRPLILGGSEIPYHLGLEGHSDADVLTHAIMDSLLGALGMGDIGRHFPDSDPDYKGASSMGMLREVMAMVKGEGYRINNVDATVVAEAPKLGPYFPEMKERLSEALEASKDRINIKATTSEGMGFCGRAEGMAAFAVTSVVE